MFQCSIGDIGARVIAPPRSLDLFVYVDAGGHAIANRVWGGFAVVGRRENAWLGDAVAQIRSTNSTCVDDAGEVKGGPLPTPEIHKLGREVERRRMTFWANWFPPHTHPDMPRLHDIFVDANRDLRANRRLSDWSLVDYRNRMRERYLVGRLKPINTHKVVSTIAHLWWLHQTIERKGMGYQIGAVDVWIDDESLPEQGAGCRLIKDYLAAGLQSAGMSTRLTGAAYREDPSEGAVRVQFGDSRRVPGLQCVDILLQAVQRQLPGFGEGRSGMASGGAA